MTKRLLIYSSLFLLAIVLVFASLQLFKNLTTKKQGKTSLHGNEIVKTVKDFPSLKDLKEGIQETNPSGENWSIAYESKAPLGDKFVISVDAKSDEDTFKQAVADSFKYFTDKSFDPCREPLSLVIFVEIKNPANTSWKPCS